MGIEQIPEFEIGPEESGGLPSSIESGFAEFKTGTYEKGDRVFIVHDGVLVEGVVEDVERTGNVIFFRVKKTDGTVERVSVHDLVPENGVAPEEI